MGNTAEQAGSGFQGSETSWAEVTIHQDGQDPVAVCPPTLKLSGRRRGDDAPSLIACATTKALGQASGSFVVTLKPGREASRLIDRLTDDAWVDIVFYRHARPWHTMRGLLDEIRRTDVMGGGGATVSRFTLTGRDHGKIWEVTPVWFSPWANDLVTDAVANQVFQGVPQVLGAPPDVVQAYLKSFLEAIGQRGPDWRPPSTLPGLQGPAFLQNVVFHTAGYQNVPARRAFNPNYLSPQGTLWALAVQQADPAFVEVWTDLLPGGDPLSAQLASGEPVPVGKAQMTVVVRDRPFPTLSTEGHLKGYQDAWGSLPIARIPRQQVLQLDLGRSGLERFNAFFVAHYLQQEAMKAGALNILAPLLDEQDMQVHGLRRYDVQGSMMPDPVMNVSDQMMIETQRALARDWYCMNPYLLSGQVELAIGRPDIRVGQRVVIPELRAPELVFGGGPTLPQPEINLYVEQVGHSWQFGQTTKTHLGVTRGWVGDDASYRAALAKMILRYKIPSLIPDSAVTSGIGSA